MSENSWAPRIDLSPSKRDLLPAVRERHSGPIPLSFADQRRPSLVPPAAGRIAATGFFVTAFAWFLTGLALSGGNSSVTLPPFPTPAQAATLVAASVAAMTLTLLAVWSVVHWVRYSALVERYESEYLEWHSRCVAKDQSRYDAALVKVEESEALQNFWYDLNQYKINWRQHYESNAQLRPVVEMAVFQAFAEHVVEADYFGELSLDEQARSFAPKLAGMQLRNLDLLHDSDNETIQAIVRNTPSFPPRFVPSGPRFTLPSLPASHPWKKREKGMLRIEDAPVPLSRAGPKPLA